MARAVASSDVSPIAATSPAEEGWPLSAARTTPGRGWTRLADGSPLARSLAFDLAGAATPEARAARSDSPPREPDGGSGGAASDDAAEQPREHTATESSICPHCSRRFGDAGRASRHAAACLANLDAHATSIARAALHTPYSSREARLRDTPLSSWSWRARTIPRCGICAKRFVDEAEATWHSKHAHASERRAVLSSSASSSAIDAGAAGPQPPWPEPAPPLTSSLRLLKARQPRTLSGVGRGRSRPGTAPAAPVHAADADRAAIPPPVPATPPHPRAATSISTASRSEAALPIPTPIRSYDETAPSAATVTAARTTPPAPAAGVAAQGAALSAFTPPRARAPAHHDLSAGRPSPVPESRSQARQPPSPESIAAFAPVMCGACGAAFVGAAALCVHLLACPAWPPPSAHPPAPSPAVAPPSPPALHRLSSRSRSPAHLTRHLEGEAAAAGAASAASPCDAEVSMLADSTLLLPGAEDSVGSSFGSTATVLGRSADGAAASPPVMQHPRGTHHVRSADAATAGQGEPVVPPDATGKAAAPTSAAATALTPLLRSRIPVPAHAHATGRSRLAGDGSGGGEETSALMRLQRILHELRRDETPASSPEAVGSNGSGASAGSTAWVRWRESEPLEAQLRTAAARALTRR